MNRRPWIPLHVIPLEEEEASDDSPLIFAVLVGVYLLKMPAITLMVVSVIMFIIEAIFRAIYGC